ncbi:IgGFc-binding protein-like [Malaclemys terrapin pileata]|uniref:IgGFc-binding protein-like n=1 Tax=Malaclemys terrapin pileata TaxID=2991368 RepID=UPI0023A86884|nr:IgGFc-binding protein-like [Malaclemys terrapin pileata]
MTHHHIATSPGQKVRDHYRPLPKKMWGVLREEIEAMLTLGLMGESHNEWRSPIVLVPKADGSTRFSIDFWKVSAISGFDAYPVPQAGETFHPTCQEQCVCQASGDVVCKVLSSLPNEEYKLVNGIQKCQPIGSAKCSAAGDPHYLSFDRVAFDFQGTCTYILAKTCTNTGNLTFFAVKVENVPWGNGKVSVTKLLSVEVYGLTLTLLQNRKGLVMVNNTRAHLPISLSNGALWVYQSGTSLVLHTDFNLRVSYD